MRMLRLPPGSQLTCAVPKTAGVIDPKRAFPPRQLQTQSEAGVYLKRVSRSLIQSLRRAGGVREDRYAEARQRRPFEPALAFYIQQHESPPKRRALDHASVKHRVRPQEHWPGVAVARAWP